MTLTNRADTKEEDSGDLFFGTLVRGYAEENARFARRDWLAEALDGKAL
jgi:hypothetical protein